MFLGRIYIYVCVQLRFGALIYLTDRMGLVLNSTAVLARHGHSKAKEDGGKRLWKKAWGFNLFPMFISPLGDKPCAIKNISYSHWLAAWLHLWRRLKDKMKGTKKKKNGWKTHSCMIGTGWFHACVCLGKPYWWEFSLAFPVYMNGKWVGGHTVCLRHILLLKSKVKVIWTKISKHIWPSLGIGLFRKWKCQHGIVIILRVSQPLTL